MQLRLLGGLQAVVDDHHVDLGSPKQRMVLAVLALAAPHPVRPDRLIELLWEDHDPEKALVGLQSYISNLRRILDRSVLVRDVGGYRLTCAVDLVDLETAVSSAMQSKTADAARDALADATAPPLPEFADHPVVIEATERWRRALGVALDIAATHDLDHGRAAEAAAMVEPLLGQFARHERLHVVAATAAYRSGRQSDALKIIDDLSRAA